LLAISKLDFKEDSLPLPYFLQCANKEISRKILKENSFMKNEEMGGFKIAE
jgi:hypothetical protein